MHHGQEDSNAQLWRNLNPQRGCLSTFPIKLSTNRSVHVDKYSLENYSMRVSVNTIWLFHQSANLMLDFASFFYAPPMDKIRFKSRLPAVKRVDRWLIKSIYRYNNSGDATRWFFNSTCCDFRCVETKLYGHVCSRKSLSSETRLFSTTFNSGRKEREQSLPMPGLQKFQHL